MLLLILILALIWIFSWSGPRYYPVYADRLAIVLLLWLLGAVRF